jgi:uncharacterized protein YqfA (UPF0365 family)
MNAILIILGAAASIWGLLRFLSVRTLSETRSAGLDVGWGAIFGMRMRGTRPEDVLRPAIAAKLAGIEPNIIELEGHALAGGCGASVVRALIEARMAGVRLSFNEAAALDLDGRDPNTRLRGLAPRNG